MPGYNDSRHMERALETLFMAQRAMAQGDVLALISRFEVRGYLL